MTLIERLDPSERKPLTMLQRIRDFPNGAKRLVQDFQLYQNIQEASRNPRSAWATRYKLSDKDDNGEIVTGRIPRRQFELQRRIKLDSAIIPVFFMAMLPGVGYIPMVLAFSAPRQVLTRHFMNQFEMYHYGEIEYIQRMNHYRSVYRLFFDSLKLDDLASYARGVGGDASGPFIDSLELFSAFHSEYGHTTSTILDKLQTEYQVELALSSGVLQHLPSSLSTALASYLPKSWLCKQVRQRIRAVVTDDSLLLEEGYLADDCEAMTDLELFEACLLRGLPVNIPPSRMRECVVNHLKAMSSMRKELPCAVVESEAFALFAMLSPMLRQAATFASADHTAPVLEMRA